MSKKLYVLEIDDIEDDLDNIEEFVRTGEPVIIFEDIEDLEDLVNYFEDWHNKDSIVYVEKE